MVRTQRRNPRMDRTSCKVRQQLLLSTASLAVEKHVQAKREPQVMGPFDIDRQYARMESIERLLSNPNLPTRTRELWTRILNNLAFDEDTYNARVMYAYRNHNKEIIQWR